LPHQVAESLGVLGIDCPGPAPTVGLGVQGTGLAAAPQPPTQRRQTDAKPAGDLPQRAFVVIDRGRSTFPKIVRVGLHEFPPLNGFLRAILRRGRSNRESL
jgi:hypothetical protein